MMFKNLFGADCTYKCKFAHNLISRPQLIYNPVTKVMETCTSNTCMGTTYEIKNQNKLVNRVKFLGYKNFFGGVSRFVWRYWNKVMS